MLHLTLLTFIELAEDGEKLGGGGTAKARQDFPQSVTADSKPALIWLTLVHQSEVGGRLMTAVLCA